ncbi:hypothetical protein ALC62_08081 [Cyphomyrmex costatus]|uniref:Uncharacterized protein n=1 Tax=Cyphomyrmex costatus TaxID=456900 RepID=A0A151IH71_9HYME|nr:hypothetical protein ALC62_08081 [Cyphomyrmex costatus]
MEHGHYCHFGIAHGLTCIFKSYNAALIPPEIMLSINIDGLPLVKSSSSQLWPILGSIRNFFNKEPFLIGAFHGYKKPPSPDIFLKELLITDENGFYFNGKIIPFKTACYICNAPARAYIYCIKNHTGYYRCSKCETRGEYRSRQGHLNQWANTGCTDDVLKWGAVDEYSAFIYLKMISNRSRKCLGNAINLWSNYKIECTSTEL